MLVGRVGCVGADEIFVKWACRYSGRGEGCANVEFYIQSGSAILARKGGCNCCR